MDLSRISSPLFFSFSDFPLSDNTHKIASTSITTKNQNMATKTTTMAAVLTVALLVVATSLVAEAQSTDCISKLVQCAQYLNTTGQPGADCCTAIKSVVETELDCLCKIYNQPGGLSAYGIDVNQALALPKRCGLPNDVSTCKAFAPGSSIVTPPGAPDKKNGVDRISWIGMPALLLVSATIFLY